MDLENSATGEADHAREVADERGAPSMELEPILSLRLIRTSCTAYADCEEAKWSRTEVSSPPRVTACAELQPNLASVPGLAMELATVDGQGAPPELRLSQSSKEGANFASCIGF